MERLWRTFSSYFDTATAPVLRPLPSSAEDFRKELSSFQNLDPDSEPPSRAKLYHWLLSSVKIKRPFELAMILLVGSSGVGKSSTINHLLDTGEGLPVAMTSASESKTKATSEYILTVDEPRFEVSDLKMSIIDTPGFNDTDGINQDACNFVSIKEFFETHPRLLEQFTYPNLVFLVVNAMDQRIKGPSSNLSKVLRGIKLLGMVDTNYPNLVVVLTFCCSVGHKDVNKWKKKLQEKSGLISDAVFELLGVQAPVVFLENDVDEHELKKDGDFTVLPDGERQPKNLYNACLELLERNKDHFGLMVLNAFFTRTRKDCPTSGHKAEAKNSRAKMLSGNEKEFFEAYCEIAKGGLDPLAARAMEYIEETKLDETQKQEIFKLVESMKSLGIKDEANLHSVTFGQINSIYDGNISTHGVEMLEKTFGIKRVRSSFNSADYLGQGYDITVEKFVPVQIMKFLAVDDATFGFTIPLCAQIVKVNETREFNMDFQSDESYIKSRLKSLGLNISLAPTILRLAPQCGVRASWKNDKNSQSSETTKTRLIEYRVAQISMGNFESNEVQFTREFSSAVANLPDRYTNEEKNNHEFKRFFQQFGQFVVTSAYIGGAYEVKTCAESSEISKRDENAINSSADANISGVTGINMSGKYQPSIESAKNDVLRRTETRWQGGRSDLHHKSTLESDEKLRLWKASLSEEPTLLTNEMSLAPISSLVSIIDKAKGDVCYRALCDMFKNDHQPVRNRQEQCVLEAKRKRHEAEEEKKQRNESNKRMGATKDPDTKGWWETITEPWFFVGGAVVCVVILAVAAFF